MVNPAPSTMTDADFGLEVRALLAPTTGTVDSKLSLAAKTPAPHPQQEAPVGPLRQYSHESMIELMIEHPEYTHAQFSAAFGRKPQWFASVLASEAFQRALEPHREKIADPGLAANMEERMRALAMQSLEVLQGKLNGSSVPDATILKALEIGTKSLGMGTPAALPPATPPSMVGPEAVAERIMLAMEKGRARKNLQAVDVVVKDKSDAN